jgi:EAL domain-containing protein (putative c-di-GMP-specific phosphodiesterase class I)
VVAQGVENDEQVTLLRSLGCDEVQGFLWSPPLPATECEPLLAAGTVQASKPRPTARGTGRRRGRR